MVNRIKELREVNNMSKETFAVLFECRVGDVKYLEGTSLSPSTNQCITLAKYFNVSLDYFLNITEDKGHDVKCLENYTESELLTELVMRDFETKPRSIRLKELRLDKSLNKSDIGKLLSIQTPVVTRLETCGIPMELKRFANIAHYFGVSVEYLLGSTEKKESQPRFLYEYSKKELLEELLVRDFNLHEFKV